MDDIPTCKFSHHVFLPMLLVLCPLFHSSHAARDTISQRQSITITETIVSADAEFELGFLRPGRNSTNQYVGIWFKKVSLQTITWVANRDHPITSSTAVLTISNDGNLVIMDGRLSYMVSNLPSYANASATLLDSGNLVLRDENSKILWQSFDFPSHTLLPGMKLGYSNCICWNPPSSGIYYGQNREPNVKFLLFVGLLGAVTSKRCHFVHAFRDLNPDLLEIGN
nr:putative inactive G-type lectin S-receptor-like serine/threonine-protein kinase SRK [Quercus suber]